MRYTFYISSAQELTFIEILPSALGNCIVSFVRIGENPDEGNIAVIDKLGNISRNVSSFAQEL